VRRQPDFSTTSRPSRVPAWQQLALAACGLVALGTALQAFLAREEARSAESRRTEVSRDVAAAAGRLQALEAGLRFPGGGALAPEAAPPARIVAELAALLPDDVRLERIAIDYQRGGMLELLVVARDAAAWDRLLRQLEAAPRFREVEPGPEARAAEVRSLVRARWAAGSR
jgi:hypothetical protein